MANTGFYQNPHVNPIPNPDPFTAHHIYPTPDYPAYYSQKPNNPDPHFATVDPNHALVLIQPPGVDPFAPPSVIAPYTHQSQEVLLNSDAAAYYQDPGAAAAVQNWIAASTHNVTDYTTGVAVATSGTENLIPTTLGSTFLTTQATSLQRKNAWRKGPKKTKLVQPAWCDVCKIDCNSKGVLDQHKLGKKHRKNLEKLLGTISTNPVATVSKPLPTPAPASLDKPIIGPEENPEKAKAAGGLKTRRKTAECAEDLESKRRKILEGGAAADSVRMCTVCSVVCNSETVFNYHLAGQKHASMLKKHASRTGIADAI